MTLDQPFALPLDDGVRPGGRFHAVLAAVVAILLLAAVTRVGVPAMGTGGGATAELGTRPAPQAAPGSIDAADAVEEVQHQVRPVPGEPGVLTAIDGRYSARFDRSGFQLRAAPEARGPATRRFGIDLQQVGRDRAIPLDTGDWYAEGNVARRAVAARMIEQVTATDGEVEWDLVLEGAPTGDGPLVVEADVHGASGRGSSAHGALRWSVAGGGSVAMGELVVKDADGVVLHRVLPEATHGGVRLEVPAEVLEGARYPVTLDPSVRPEWPVTTATYGPAEETQHHPAVAFDGTNYLVVWADARAGRKDRFMGLTALYDVYATRVTKAGAVLDPRGIPIAAGRDSRSPDVTFDGTNYVVVWAETYDGSGGRGDIFGARVSTAGSVLDPNGIPISEAFDQQDHPAVAFDGTNSLVVWEDRRGEDGDVYGARVSKAGTVLDPNGVVISAADFEQGSPALAFDGTNYLVSWNSYPTVYAARVSKALGVLDPTGIRLSTTDGQPYETAVAFDGTNYLVVWSTTRPFASTDIYGVRVTTAGAVLSPRDIRISTSPFPDDSPSVVFDGTNHLVVWQRDTIENGYEAPAVYGARVSTAGVVLDSTSALLSPAAGGQYTPDLAFDGTNSLLVWGDVRFSGNINLEDVLASRVSKTAAVVAPAAIHISTDRAEQVVPKVAFDGTNYLVVWTERRRVDLNFDVYAARVRRDGTLLDGTGIPVATTSGKQVEPAVAFDGTDYLVVWRDNRSGEFYDLYASRVTTAGVVATPNGQRVSNGAGDEASPAITFDGTNYLVAWTDTRANPGSEIGDVYAARIGRSGNVLDANGIPVAAGAADQYSPAVASDGTSSLVVWADGSGVNTDVRGARVTSAGVVLDALASLAISTAPDAQTTPAVAFDGDTYFAVWGDHRSGTTWDVYGTRISKLGVVRDAQGIPLSTAASDQEWPSVAANGSFLVAWRDRRAGVAVYGTRVDGSGRVLDPSGLVIAAPGGVPDDLPSVAVTKGDSWGVAYFRRIDAGRTADPARTFLRTVSPK